MKVIYAENWKKRMASCKEINKKNRYNLIILKCILTFCICGFILAHIPHAIEYYKSVKMVVIIVVFSAFAFFVIWTYGASVAGKLFDEITGGKPMFTPVVDAGATLSYLLKEKNAKIEFKNGCYFVKYEKNKEIQLKDVKIVEWGVTEPGLDLNKMEIVVPYDWLEKAEKIKWEVATYHSSDVIKELAKVKL